ncbi:MAG: aminomethyl-transferring glycine dehydrogenase subunit GcvPB [Parachlamydiaceae bacterium]|nr:aminomethyl-transferring glycine dehydrogenase subunit GcvPB [Parachlamydiaceae bacterium]
MTRTVFEKSQAGQHAYSLPKSDPEWEVDEPPAQLLRKSSLDLPEISEIDLTRHFSQLAQRNMGIDTNFYPLGSCTMKLNPRVNELCAQFPGFVRTHPLAPDDSVQGNLELIHDLLKILCELCGMTAGSLLPNAGAQGEYVGIRMISAYHRKRGDLKRTEILIPDSAHGTNPATASIAGFTIVPIRTNRQGDMDLDHLREMTSEHTAGLMLTNPNTLGLFSPVIMEICEIVHAKGGLLYYDGANMNAILNIAKPGEMGFDVMHLNLHKTFSTPHGGGGPGSGPVLCNDKLKPFLPVPRVECDQDKYKIVWSSEASIGHIASFHGNFSIYLRAYLYAMLHGNYGLRRIGEQSVLNANYLKSRIKNLFKVPFEQACMHEFVVQADRFVDKGVRALDIAKRLLDYGIYAPTIYFPLIIKECLLIEPTESESKDTLDHFIAVLEKIVEEIERDPEFVKSAPHNLSIGRLDEVRAAKQPILKERL